MKLSQTRLREIIQEEVARMEARGQREPTPRASFFNAVATAARKEIKKLAPTRTQRNNLWDMYKGNWDEAVEQGMEADLAKDVLVQIEQEKRLGLFDRGSLEEAKPGESPPESPPDLQKLKADAITAIKALSSAQGKEGQIIQFLTNLIDLINTKKADTQGMMTHLTRAQDEAEKIAK